MMEERSVANPGGIVSPVDAALGEEVGERLQKGPLAFRTISEVADELKVPQHVLRFWETRFEQVRPLKRGGGRRYYRPEDIALLRQISDLLYVKGYTIKGVQRVLRGESDSESENTPALDGQEVVSVSVEDELPPLVASPEEKPPEPKVVVEVREVPDPHVVAENERLRRSLERVLGQLEVIRAKLKQASV
ncbi:MerR family transcriptional regulator [Acetobacter estunensis]|nr:MerR family transcriptional regulator [Acetobacter estunensis]MBV1837983.1 MerR family transcriptional regulator [Acetobacter estunensis]